MVSRFPIVRPGGSTVPGSPGGRIPDGMAAYLLLGDGAVAAIAQTHTPWWPDGMRVMLKGGTPEEVAAADHGKVAWTAPHLEATAPAIDEGLPTFFVGDLNSASHLDWTPEAVEALGWQPPYLDPPGRTLPVRVAHHGGHGGCGVPRFLSRGQPRSDRRPRLHLLQRPVSGVRALRHLGSHRLRGRGRPDHHDPQPGGGGRRSVHRHREPAVAHRSPGGGLDRRRDGGEPALVRGPDRRGREGGPVRAGGLPRRHRRPGERSGCGPRTPTPPRTPRWCRPPSTTRPRTARHAWRPTAWPRATISWR